MLLQNAFDAALLTWLARIPVRIGYARDARRPLLTQAIKPPEPGETPPHQRFYYLELLKRAGWIGELPECADIRLHGVKKAAEAGRSLWRKRGLPDGPWIGVSPGAAYGGAKRWIPEHFAQAAHTMAGQLGARVAVFGSKAEADLARTVAAETGPEAVSLAGETSLAGVHRAGGDVLALSDERFRADACGGGVGDSDGGDLRGDGSCCDRAVSVVGAGGAAGSRLHAVFAARVFVAGAPLHAGRHAGGGVRGSQKGAGRRGLGAGCARRGDYHDFAPQPCRRASTRHIEAKLADRPPTTVLPSLTLTGGAETRLKIERRWAVLLPHWFGGRAGGASHNAWRSTLRVSGSLKKRPSTTLKEALELYFDEPCATPRAESAPDRDRDRRDLAPNHGYTFEDRLTLGAARSTLYPRRRPRTGLDR